MAQNPILIYSDTKRIATAINFLNDSVETIQDIYNEFKQFGIEVTIQDITDRLHFVLNLNRDHIPRLKTFVLDKLASKAAGSSFNGVPISALKLRDMIELPDLSQLIELLDAAPKRSEGVGYEPQMLSLVNDVVSVKPSAEATLTARHSFYTKNDGGIEILDKLKKICTAMNDYSDFLFDSGLIYDRSNFQKGLALKEQIGVIATGSGYTPDIELIRKYEHNWSLSNP